MSDFNDEGLLKDYFDEAFSQIEIIEQNILILEKDRKNKEAIDALFRAAHTLKGGSATVQMDEIMTFTHLLEDVMDDIRSGKIKIDSSIIDVLLSALDIIKTMVNERSKGNVYKKDYSKTTNNLNNIIKKAADNSQAKSKTKKETSKSEIEKNKDLSNDSRFTISEYDLLEISQSNHDNLPLFKVIVELDEANPMRTVGGIQIFTSLREIGSIIKTIPEFDEIYSDIFHKEIMYIVASKRTVDQIKDYATIPDATKKVLVIPIGGDSGVKKNPGNTKKKEDEIIKEDLKQTSGINKENIAENIKEEIEIENEIEENNEAIDEISDQLNKKEMEEVKKQKEVSSSILRVDSSRIDYLLNLVSEIVINKATFNQIGNQFNDNIDLFLYTLNEYKDKIRQFFDKITSFSEEIKSEEILKSFKADIQKNYHDLYIQFDNFTSKYKATISRFKSNNQILDRISSSLQEGVMRVRMVPMKQIFSRFPRLVRDLSKGLKKDINLIINGEDTEIDKAMIDDLIDPLIHIVRNSIDHGVETPAEREKIGKPNPASLEITAMNEGNIISLSVSDDGKGIDVDRIREKAIEKKLISPDTILKDQDAYNLLFEPGFSTAEKVTALSGRGVGLDVVKKNIEKLSGSIRITSESGYGTVFTIKIPLTLAIIQGLMVEVYNEAYVIPISSVIESIRIKPEEIKSIDNYEVINVREDVLSLLRLNKLFKLGEDKTSDYYFVIIIGTSNKKIGLLVDSIIGEEDIVIKPLRDKYTSTPGIAGATILGDGTVSLILDVSQLIDLGLKIEEEKHSKKA